MFSPLRIRNQCGRGGRKLVRVSDSGRLRENSVFQTQQEPTGTVAAHTGSTQVQARQNSSRRRECGQKVPRLTKKVFVSDSGPVPCPWVYRLHSRAGRLWAQVDSILLLLLLFVCLFFVLCVCCFVMICLTVLLFVCFNHFF